MWPLLYIGLLGLLLISLLIFKLTQRIARASPSHRRPMEGDPDAHTGLEAEEEVEEPEGEDEPVQEVEREEEPPAEDGGIAAVLEEIEEEGVGDQEAAPIGVTEAGEEGALVREEGGDGVAREAEAFPEEKLEEAYMGYGGEGDVDIGTTEAPSPEIAVPPPQPKEVEAKPEVPREEVEGMEVGEGTSAAGMTLSQTDLKALSGAEIAAIERGGRTIEAKPGEKILVGDRLLIRGPREARERAKVVLQEEVRRIHLRQVIDQLAEKQKDLEEAKELKRSVAAGKSELMESLDKRYKELMEAYAKDAETEISEGKEGAEKRVKAAKGGEGPGKKSKKRVKDMSPKEYRDCFGNAEDYEKCKRDCGSEEECAKAVRLLEDV